MKKILLAVALLLVAALAYLAIAGQKLQIISTQIDIAAPPEKVWRVLTDINAWQEWNPMVSASTGEAAVGAELSLTMISEVDGEDGPQYNPRIVQMDEPHLFLWRAQMGASFIFTNEKIFELKATETGTTVIHRETFKGMMAAAMRSQMEQGVAPILNSMNESLKATAEQSP